MTLTFIEANAMVATERIRDDGIAAFYDRCKADRQFKLSKPNDIVPIVNNKSGYIESGKHYVEYCFCDENAEQYILNISKEMVSVIKRNQIFPQSITNKLL